MYIIHTSVYMYIYIRTHIYVPSCTLLMPSSADKVKTKKSYTAADLCMSPYSFGNNLYSNRPSPMMEVLHEGR